MQLRWFADNVENRKDYVSTTVYSLSAIKAGDWDVHSKSLPNEESDCIPSSFSATYSSKLESVSLKYNSRHCEQYPGFKY